jgi:hypothetical protein
MVENRSILCELWMKENLTIYIQFMRIKVMI